MLSGAMLVFCAMSGRFLLTCNAIRNLRKGIGLGTACLAYVSQVVSAACTMVHATTYNVAEVKYSTLTKKC